MRITRLHATVSVAIIAAIFLILFIAEKHFADRSAVDAITPGLSHSNLVERLGVMYDSIKTGEYDDMDGVLAGMPRNDSITLLCIWRVRYSRDLLWVGLDDSDTVISVWLQKR